MLPDDRAGSRPAVSGTWRGRDPRLDCWPLAQCTSNYPCFYPVGYTVDTVIPLINVHRAEYWGPDGHAAWGWLWADSAWAATGLGWALATLLVAGYTRLVRQE